MASLRETSTDRLLSNNVSSATVHRVGSGRIPFAIPPRREKTVAVVSLQWAAMESLHQVSLPRRNVCLGSHHTEAAAHRLASTHIQACYREYLSPRPPSEVLAESRKHGCDSECIVIEDGILLGTCFARGNKLLFIRH